MEHATASAVGGMIPARLLDIFDATLKDIRSAFPGSYPVIGGGALRDAYHGRPIKDIDVFMRRCDHADLDHPNTRKVPTPAIFAVGYQGRPDMHGAWDFLCPHHIYPTQLILADFRTFADLAHTFDLGLSRITYDGDHLFATEEFLMDSREKVFRIRRCDNDREFTRSMKRINRLLEKYPDFRNGETFTLEEL